MWRKALLLISVCSCAAVPAFKPSVFTNLVTPATAIPLPEPEPAIEIEGSDFDTIPVDHVQICTGLVTDNQCTAIDAGFVLSEQTYARAIISVSIARRFAAENLAILKLRAEELDAMRKAEEAYQQHIVSLERTVYALKTPSLWERSKAYLGFIGGSIVSIIVFAAGR